MLGRRGRVVRGAATATCAVLLLIGTVWGDDDHFPFGPMRMYSTTNAPSGRVRIIRLEGKTESGRRIRLNIPSFGVRRAEVDGQMDRLRADPSLLGDLVTAYERIKPDEPRLIELHVIIGTHRLRNRRSVSYREEVVASWNRS